MSTSPDSPLGGLFAGLSADQLIAEEEDCQGIPPPTPSTLGKRTLPPGSNENEDDSDEESASPGNESLPSNPSSLTHPNTRTLQMDQAIRKMTKRLKLSSENVSLVEQFSQVGIVDSPLRTN